MKEFFVIGGSVFILVGIIVFFLRRSIVQAKEGKGGCCANNSQSNCCNCSLNGSSKSSKVEIT